MCSGNHPNTISHTSGYLSSSVIDNKGCGSSKSPWIISANPGQTINIDMIDFAADEENSVLISCSFVYGFILEKSLAINYTICGGSTRKKGGLYVEIKFCGNTLAKQGKETL